MKRTDTGFRFVLPLFLLILLSSCSSSVPPSRRDAAHVAARKLLVPHGWSDITSKAPGQAVILWLMKNDRGASLVLRELKVLSSNNVLDEEDVCVFGNISLRNRLNKPATGRRVTRSPSRERNDRLCEYVYAEGALLRRVLVFRTHSALYELELMQMNGADPLESAVDVQTGLALSYMDQ